MKVSKKILLFTAVCCIGAAPAMPVYAADSTTETENGSNTSETSRTDSEYSLFDTDMNELLNVMNSSISSGKSISLSEAFNQLNSFAISTDSYKDISDLKLSDSFDIGTVNLQYCSLTTELISQHKSVDLSGQSDNCLNLFENTYGNVLDEISLKEPTLPKGFNVETMLSQGKQAIEDAYSQATSSSDFSAVKNSISLGSVFSKAKQGLSMPGLASSDQLSNMIQDSVSSQKNSISGEYDARRSWINEKRSDVKQNQLSNLNSNFLNATETWNKNKPEGAAGESSSSDKSAAEDSGKSEKEKNTEEVNSYITRALDQNGGSFDSDTIVTAYYYYVISSDNVSESEQARVKSEGLEAFIKSDQNRLMAQTWYETTQY